jgi:hypothetical protein
MRYVDGDDRPTMDMLLPPALSAVTKSRGGLAHDLLASGPVAA